MSPLSYLFLVIWVFYIFFLVIPNKIGQFCWSFSKYELMVSFTFCMVFLFCSLLIYTLIFIMFSLLLVFSLLFQCFKVKSYVINLRSFFFSIWEFSYKYFPSALLSLHPISFGILCLYFNYYQIILKFCSWFILWLIGWLIDYYLISPSLLFFKFIFDIDLWFYLLVARTHILFDFNYFEFT